jgi:hypothetical protein
MTEEGRGNGGRGKGGKCRDQLNHLFVRPEALPINGQCVKEIPKSLHIHLAE